MEFFIEGPRFTNQSLMQANAAPPEALPVLTDEQKRIASEMRMSEESYARDLYAYALAEPEWMSVLKRLGILLNAFFEESLPGTLLQSLTWRTSYEMFQVLADWKGHPFAFRFARLL